MNYNKIVFYAKKYRLNCNRQEKLDIDDLTNLAFKIPYKRFKKDRRFWSFFIRHAGEITKLSTDFSSPEMSPTAIRSKTVLDARDAFGSKLALWSPTRVDMDRIWENRDHLLERYNALLTVKAEEAYFEGLGRLVPSENSDD